MAEGAKNLAYWFFFFFLGTLNNLGYVIVDAAAKPLAKDFGHENMLGAVKWANVSMGLVMRSVNTFLLDGRSYTARVCFNGGMMLVGFVGACLAKSLFDSFVFFLVCCVFIGSSSTFGESVLLGFTRVFPPGVVGGWSSGTGMAGVLGSSSYLLMSFVFEMSSRDIFTVLVPTAYIYLGIFLLLEANKPTAGQNQDRGDEAMALQSAMDAEEDGDRAVAATLTGIEQPLLHHRLPHSSGGAAAAPDDHNDDLVENDASATAPIPKEHWLTKAHRCHMLVLWNAINLGAVYFLEYAITTAFSSTSQPEKSDSDSNFVKKLIDNHFVILSLCYQVGVFISRSSTSVIVVSRIEIFTVLQTLLFGVWLGNSFVHFMNMWVQYFVMITVGLMGGASYVNIFLKIRTNAKISADDKEMAINIACIYINFGIVSACIFSLIANNTFLAK